MNFVIIVGTIDHIFHPLSSCYELIYCFPWGYMILYQIIFMCILNSNMSWVLFSLSLFFHLALDFLHTKNIFQIQAQYLPMMYFQMCDD